MKSRGIQWKFDIVFPLHRLYRLNASMKDIK